MATTRQIARRLEKLLEDHGNEIMISANFGDARFEVIAQRVDYNRY